MDAYLPRVSVVVAVYNAQATIEACLQSLLAQDYPADLWELVAVDNNSTDATRKILAGYGDQIVLVDAAKQGPAAARNCGIAHSSGEIIALTDADCILDPGWLRHLVQPLKDEEVGLVGGTIRATQPDNPIEAFGEKIHDHQAAIEVYTPPYVITMSWAARRSLIDTIGPFDEAFLRGSDTEYSLRVYQAGYKFAYAADALLYHQNEHTWFGLFEEGYIHGLHSNHIIKKHHRLIAKGGHSRINWKAYRRLGRSFGRALNGADKEAAKCQFVFDLGKKIGKVFGSVRFGYIDL